MKGAVLLNDGTKLHRNRYTDKKKQNIPPQTLRGAVAEYI